MFEWSKGTIVFIKGHSPYNGSEVFVNAAMIAGASVEEINLHGKTAKATRITTFGADGHGNGVYEVKESFQELIDKANGTASKTMGV